MTATVLRNRVEGAETLVSQLYEFFPVPQSSGLSEVVYREKTSLWLRPSFPSLRPQSASTIEPTPAVAFESPFDRLENLQSPARKLTDLISNVVDLLKQSYGERLATRLRFLVSAAIEEQELPVSLESLRSFVVFLREFPGTSYPDVVLSPEGNIRTEWRKGDKSLLAVEFLPGDLCRFALLVADPIRPDRPQRIAGVTFATRLLRVADTFGASDWVLQ